MQADMRVLRLSDQESWLDTEPGATDVVVRHLSTYKVGREVEIAQPGPTRRSFAVIGPAAPPVRRAPGPRPRARSPRARGWRRQLPRRRHRPWHRPDLPGGRSPGGRRGAGRGGRRPGLRAGGRDPAGRVRAPRFGREMSAATIPQEAGIDERAVSFTKGCYIGQETVARLHYKGKPNRHLRGLSFEAPVTAGDPIALEGRDVGRVGTAVVSPAHGPIALAVIRREAAPGSHVAVGEGGVVQRSRRFPSECRGGRAVARSAAAMGSGAWTG